MVIFILSIYVVMDHHSQRTEIQVGGIWKAGRTGCIRHLSTSVSKYWKSILPSSDAFGDFLELHVQLSAYSEIMKVWVPRLCAGSSEEDP
jgi:hypothetical protein